MVADRFPDCEPSAEPLRLMLRFPLVIFFGLLKVSLRTCVGSSLLLPLPLLPQPATAAGMSRAITSAATRVRMRVNSWLPRPRVARSRGRVAHASEGTTRAKARLDLCPIHDA